MKTFTVHEPVPAVEAARGARLDMRDRVDRGDALVFVPDGFDWRAALFAPVILLADHVYRGLAVYALVIAAVVTILVMVGAAPAWIVLVVAALHLFVGFEYGELKRSELDTRGWIEHGPVTGRTLDECERRFYGTWMPSQPVMKIEPPSHRPEAHSTPAAQPQLPLSPPLSRWRRLLSRHRS